MKIIHPDDREYILKRVEAQQKGVSILPPIGKFKIITKSGKVKFIESYSTYIMYEGKIAVFTTSIDITERKKAEEKLKDSEEKFRKIVENSLMGILIIQDGLFRYVNNAMSQINEYSIEEMINWTPEEYLDTVHPDDREFVLSRVVTLQKGMSTVPSVAKFRIISKSGRVIFLETYSTTMMYEGKPAVFNSSHCSDFGTG